MSRPFVIRRSDKSSGAFATGKNAISICQRSGFKFPYREMVFEAGTNTWVHRSEDDGQWDLINHPQNYPPEKRTERIALRWAHPETNTFDLSGVVSADQIWFVSITSISTFVCVGTGVSTVVSIGTGTSGAFTYSLDFSKPQNSQYFVLVFPGI